MSSPPILSLVPVAPGRRRKRGLQFATTRRLRELKDRYEGIANDPNTDAGLRHYASDLVAECVAELRARNRQQQRRAA